MFNSANIKFRLEIRNGWAGAGSRPGLDGQVELCKLPVESHGQKLGLKVMTESQNYDLSHTRKKQDQPDKITIS